MNNALRQPIEIKKQWLWYSLKDGWQVTSFHPKDDPAIGFPRNGDARLYINTEAYEAAVDKIAKLEKALEKCKEQRNFHLQGDEAYKNYEDQKAIEEAEIESILEWR